jgi:hypothetical protein
VFGILNGRVDPSRAGPDLNQRTDASAWCPGFGASCTQPILSQIGELVLTNVTGFLDGSTLDPSFILTLSAVVPGTGANVTGTCPTGSAPAPYFFPIIHGAPPQVVQQVTVSYRDLKNYISVDVPFTLEEAEVILRPITCDGTNPPLGSSCN